MQDTSYRSRLLALTIVTSSPIVAMFLFGSVVYYLHTYEHFSRNAELIRVFMWIVPTALTACLGISFIVFRAAIGRIAKSTSLEEKFSKYQNAVILRMALIETPGLLGCVAALTTGYLYFLGAAFIVTVIFLFLRPSVFTIASDLALSKEETELLK